MTNKEAIETLKRAVEILKSEAMHESEFAEALKVAIEALEQTRWIPCNKQLPQKIDTYIVCASTGSVFLSRWEGSAFSAKGKVIAWMKRPKAYDKKEEK